MHYIWITRSKWQKIMIFYPEELKGEPINCFSAPPSLKCANFGQWLHWGGFNWSPSDPQGLGPIMALNSPEYEMKTRCAMLIVVTGWGKDYMLAVPFERKVLPNFSLILTIMSEIIITCLSLSSFSLIKLRKVIGRQRRKKGSWEKVKKLKLKKKFI